MLIQKKWAVFEFDKGFNSEIKVPDSHVHTKLPVSQWFLVISSLIQTMTFTDYMNSNAKKHSSYLKVMGSNR